MKKIFILIVLLFVFLDEVFATNYCNDANCQGCWLFTEGSGTTVADDSANSYTGTFKASGEPVWASASPPTGHTYYVTFDGSNDYIENTSFVHASTNFTVYVLANMNNLNDVAGHFWSSRAGAGGGGYTFNSETYNNSGKMGMTLLGVADYASALSTTTGSWRHFFLLFGTTSATVYDESSSDTFSVGTMSGPNANGYEMGRGWANGGFQSEAAIDGSVAEIAYFDRVLTSTEVTDIETNGLVPAATTRRVSFAG